MKIIRRYSELKRLRSFEERYRYLRLDASVGCSTFGYDRHLNQMLYTSRRWQRTRDVVIMRDEACDLGDLNYEIQGRIIVHHMNPITLEDIEYGRDIVFDPRYLICTSHNTHNAIHYGDESLLPELPIERRRFDTCPWR